MAGTRGVATWLDCTRFEVAYLGADGVAYRESLAGCWNVRFEDSPAQQGRDPSPISRAVGDTAWLFPGSAAGRPARPSSLGRTLQRHGIAAGPGRTAALNALTAELSRATVSDLLGGNPRHLRTPRKASQDEQQLTRRR